MGHEMTVAVGDVHGCRGKLISLLRWCDEVGRGKKLKYVFLGDYIDRGPDSRAVVDLLIRRQRADPDSVVCLRGNHEQMLVNASNADCADRDLMTWLGNGGEQTLQSYCCDDPRDLPPDHLDWFRSLPLAHCEEGRFFVHAGIRPEIP